MLVVVVSSTEHGGIGLIGGTAIALPLGDVVDLAQLGGEVTTGVFTAPDQQSRGLSGATGEQPLATSEIDHDPVGVDHDAANVAGQRRAEYVVGMQRNPVAGPTDAGRSAAPDVVDEFVDTPRRQARERIDRAPAEVGGGGQPCVEQNPSPRVSVDGDVHERLRRRPDLFGGRRRTEDRNERVESALPMGAWSPLAVSVVAGPALERRAIVAVFDLHESFVDCDHLRRRQPVASRRLYIQCPADSHHAGTSTLHFGVPIVVCPVLVGPCDDVIDDRSEVPIRHLLCVHQQVRNEGGQLVADTRVGMRDRQLQCLRHSEPTLGPHLAESIEIVHRPCDSRPPRCFGTRPVQRRPTERVHRPMTTHTVHIACSTHRQCGRHLGIQPTPLQFVLLDPRDELGVGELDQLVDDG